MFFGICNKHINSILNIHKTTIMKRSVIFLLLLLFITNQYTYAQHWTMRYTPMWRHLHDIHVFSPIHFAAVGGNPFNDSIASATVTKDGGQFWDFFEVFPGKMFKTAAFFNSQTGLASGFNGRLYKTTNGGLSYNQISYNLPLSLLTVNKLYHAGGGVVYAAGGHDGTNAFISKSLDYGDTWTMHNTFPSHEIYGLSIPQPSHLRICGPDNYLQYSNDDGANWLSAPIVGLDSTVNLMALDFYGNLGICVGGRKGSDSMSVILRTTDNGLNWTTVMAASGPQLNDVDVINDTLAYAVGDYGLVLKTTDGGLSWIEEFISGNPMQDFYSVNFYNAHLGGICGRFGLVFTYDNGHVKIPTAVTDTALNITPNSATLHASVSAGYFPAKVSFLYGLQNPPNIEVTGDSIFTDSTTLTSIVLSGLQHLSGYYYQVKVSNPYGDFYGDVKSFNTPYPPPTVITNDAINITHQSAQLQGQLAVVAGTVSVRFEFDTISPPSQVNHVILGNYDTTQTYNLSHTITSLQQNTTYYFRLRADNWFGEYFGDIKSFTTGILNTIPVTIPATNITDSMAIINGAVTVFDDTAAVYFVYGTQNPPNIPVFIDSFANVQHMQVNYLLQGLQPNTKYFYYLKTADIYAENFGLVDSFQTFPSEPIAVLNEGTGVTSSSAHISGNVWVYNIPSNVYFLYGTSNPPQTIISMGSTANVQNLPVSYDLTGLQANTRYYYRLKISNSLTDVYTDVKNFFTGNPIPNWSFEDWTLKQYMAPKEWVALGNVEQSDCGGHIAVKMLPTNDFYLGGGTMLVNFNIPAFCGGAPITVKPSEMLLSVKYNVELNDTAQILLAFKKNGDFIAQNFFYLTGSSQGLFRDTAFQLSYFDNQMPDTVLIGFSNTNMPHNNFNNSYLEICNVRFDVPVTSIQNLDFTLWDSVYYELIDGWTSYVFYDFDNNSYETSYYRSSDAYHESYAVCFELLIYSKDLSKIETGTFSKGFPIQERHEKLFGYYKYTPQAGDTAEISVTIYDINDSICAEGKIDFVSEAADWSRFEVFINYFDSLCVPHSAKIEIEASTKKHPTSSVLCIDKLSFDGDFVPIEKPHELKPDIVVYPNPFKDVLYIDFNGLYEHEFLVEMFDLNGKRIYAEIINDIRHSISTSFLGNGLYLLRISSGKDIVLRKVIKI